MERAIAYARRRPEHPFAVIFLDLDRFKVVNDRVGHVGADAVLVALARRLEECVRAGDSVARLGGDEFALLVQDVADPSVVAQRILNELRRPFEVAGQHVPVSASMGIAISSTGFTRPEDALRDADAAMCRAKARGRARFELADAELAARSRHQVEMESQLRDAVDAGELRLHFQPVVVMQTRELVGFEALVRWCAGSTRCTACARPTTSFPWPSRRGRSWPWGAGRCARGAGRWRPGARPTPAQRSSGSA
ncbi:MAG: diguanylate cyclase domain-containing protein [Longimicrobiaceae bacterium]